MYGTETGNGSGPWSHVHDIFMELNGVDKFLKRMEGGNGAAKTRDAAAESPWKEIRVETAELTRIVQGGRRVTKEQMQAVNQVVSGQNGVPRQ